MAGGKATATSGTVLVDAVIRLAESLGLSHKKEVKSGRRIWGAGRRIDLVLTHQPSRKVLGIECKVQKTPGSAEEKIPSTLKDIEFWPIPGIVVIDGQGFSSNMTGYLMSTGRVVWFEDLEDWLKLFFVL